MMRIGFLGCGKIGKAILQECMEEEDVCVTLIQDPMWNGEAPCRVIKESEENAFQNCDLVVECATADVLKQNLDGILRHSDLFLFSVTAFSDPEFADRAEKLMKEYHRRILIPHGAILGLDGIFDGKNLWKEVTIETTKNPASLGRQDTTRTVVYEGSTRDACKAYPRNVNVHAAIALSGIGFDRTKSRIISDPAVDTNSHRVCLEGEGVSVKLEISSFTTGGVTGKYTPYSACGSFRRILGRKEGICFV